jgi:hypothetical protein
MRLLPCAALALVVSVVGAGSSSWADGGIGIAPPPEVIDDPSAFPPEPPAFEYETVPPGALPESFGSPWTEPPSMTAPPATAPLTAPPMIAAPPAARVEWDAAPPPGTLGRTYKQPSALVPKEEHPRTARIDVEATALPFVEVIGLEDFDGFRGRDGLWHFKSKRPLLPGVPHIYQVIAHDGTPGGLEDVRTVRMIPGRIVRLAF